MRDAGDLIFYKEVSILLKPTLLNNVDFSETDTIGHVLVSVP
jgi:hypothetical protein